MTPERQTLRATLRGRLVPDSDGLSYTVVGIFRHGIAFVGQSNQALYLTTKRAYGPFNLCVPNLWLAGAVFAEGQSATLEDRQVVIHDVPLTIDFTLAATPPRPVYVPALSGRQIAKQAHMIMRQIITLAAGHSAALTALASVMGNTCYAEDDSSLAKVMRSAILELFVASAEGEPYLVCKAARRLEGLGPGLTPSGDDVLAGYLAALQLLGPSLAVPAEYEVSVRTVILAQYGQRTHPLSRALLEAASQGEIAGTLLEVIRGMGHGTPPTQRQIARLMHTGHSSGLDGLAGVLLFVLAHSQTRPKAFHPRSISQW